MKHLLLTGGNAALLAAVLMSMFACAGTEPVSTEDIAAIYDPLNQRLDAASFVPLVTKEEVARRELEGARALLGDADTSILETRATVGLYTGTDNGGNQVKERRAWLVVVDDLPLIFPSGPAGSSGSRSGQRQQNQLVIFFDADTGEEIEGSISGRWVDE